MLEKAADFGVVEEDLTARLISRFGSLLPIQFANLPNSDNPVLIHASVAPDAKVTQNVTSM